MKEQKEQYIITKKLIRKCFNINFSIPKGYGTRSNDYEKWYDMKVKLIHTIVDKIKKYSLPIKYGVKPDDYGNNVIYFEFENNQFSFHRPYIRCKKFNGNWIGVKRTNYLTNKGNIIGKKDCY